MTTYEHAMVGITGAVAAGVHQRCGWRLVAIAGVAAISPDWDAIPFLWSIPQFDAGHRVWGHNLFVVPVVGALIAALDYGCDFTGRAGRWLARYIELPGRKGQAAIAEHAEVNEPGTAKHLSLVAWMTVGAVAALSHLPADLVVSGTEMLADWELKLLWPMSERGWVYPLVRWGDPWLSILFGFGMLAMALWPSRLRRTAVLTLCAVLGYLALRGAMRAI